MTFSLNVAVDFSLSMFFLLMRLLHLFPFSHNMSCKEREEKNKQKKEEEEEIYRNNVKWITSMTQFVIYFYWVLTCLQTHTNFIVKYKKVPDSEKWKDKNGKLTGFAKLSRRLYKSLNHRYI